MKCRICTNIIEFQWNNDETLKRLRLCYTCEYWWQAVNWLANGDVTDEGHRVVRVFGNLYIIRPDGQPGPQGFGGRKYVIRFLNGDEVTTHNLWHVGEIPKWFRDPLPNNAMFVDTRLTCTCRTKFVPITPEQTKCMTCVLNLKPQRW